MNDTTAKSYTKSLNNTCYNGWWDTYRWRDSCEYCAFKYTCANAKPMCYRPISITTTATSSNMTINAGNVKNGGN